MVFASFHGLLRTALPYYTYASPPTINTAITGRSGQFQHAAHPNLDPTQVLSGAHWQGYNVSHVINPRRGCFPKHPQRVCSVVLRLIRRTNLYHTYVKETAAALCTKIQHRVVSAKSPLTDRGVQGEGSAYVTCSFLGVGCTAAAVV